MSRTGNDVSARNTSPGISARRKATVKVNERTKKFRASANRRDGKAGEEQQFRPFRRERENGNRIRRCLERRNGVRSGLRRIKHKRRNRLGKATQFGVSEFHKRLTPAAVSSPTPVAGGPSGYSARTARGIGGWCRRGSGGRVLRRGRRSSRGAFP